MTDACYVDIWRTNSIVPHHTQGSNVIMDKKSRLTSQELSRHKSGSHIIEWESVTATTLLRAIPRIIASNISWNFNHIYSAKLKLKFNIIILNRNIKGFHYIYIYILKRI